MSLKVKHINFDFDGENSITILHENNEIEYEPHRKKVAVETIIKEFKFLDDREIQMKVYHELKNLIKKS